MIGQALIRLLLFLASRQDNSPLVSRHSIPLPHISNHQPITSLPKYPLSKDAYSERFASTFAPLFAMVQQRSF
jgi:hypothetical protein